MSNADIRGRFIWHELMTTDPEAASGFYSKVVPWKTQPSGMPGYTLWMAGRNRAGGLMALPPEATGTPPHWIVYVGTPNVDSTLAAAQRLGGRVLKSAADIPQVGRFAVLADPQGAAFALFTPVPGGEETPPSGGAGEFTWHELATTDQDAALRFYTELFGWSKGAAHDMGAMGTYQLFSHGGKDVGGLYRARDTSTPPHWLSYVQVADAAKAAQAGKAAGGRVIHGPVEVPGGSWIVMLLDPQGGAFAVVEPPDPAASRPATVQTTERGAGAASPGDRGRAQSVPRPKPAAASSPSPAASARTSSATGAGGSSQANSGSGKTAARKSPAKRAPARKAAAKRTRRRAGAAARVAGAKRTAAKRAAAKSGRSRRRVAKSNRAKRAVSAKRSTRAGGRKPARKTARSKVRKHR